MSFLYHIVPPKMIGDCLIPLNDMKEDHLDLYNENISKYKGREELLEEFVPGLNCLWNDVVHLSPVCPRVIYNTLVEIGHSPDKNIKFYKIPVKRIQSESAVTFLYSREDGEMTSEEVIPFNHDDFENLEGVCDATIEWYKYCLKMKRRPLLFYRVPHILVKSRISISECEIVRWSDEY